MKKYINLLLTGFLIFVIGLIALNVEISSYQYVNYLPEEFNENVDTFTMKIDKNKNYKISKAKYNQNISIKKQIDNSLKDEIIITTYHSDNSKVKNYLSYDNNEIKLIFANELVINDDKDLEKLYKLVIKCIKDKKIYNYSLLKYSKITIYGSEDVLSRIEINYDK